MTKWVNRDMVIQLELSEPIFISGNPIFDIIELKFNNKKLFKAKSGVVI